MGLTILFCILILGTSTSILNNCFWSIIFWGVNIWANQFASRNVSSSFGRKIQFNTATCTFQAQAVLCYQWLTPPGGSLAWWGNLRLSCLRCYRRRMTLTHLAVSWLVTCKLLNLVNLLFPVLSKLKKTPKKISILRPTLIRLIVKIEIHSNIEFHEIF